MNVFSNRVKALRRTLDEEELDGYIVVNESNLTYFTGLKGEGRLLIPRDGELVFFVPGVDYEYAREKVSGCRVELAKRGRETYSEISEKVKAMRFKRVGFDFMEFSTYLKLMKLLSGVKLTVISRLVQNLRKVKDETEIKNIRRAAKLTCKGLRTVFEVIKPGLREYEIAAEIEYVMRRMGSDGVAFDTIVSSGICSAFPHGGCTSKKIRKGDLVMIDVGATYQNYKADLTRTVTVGKPSSRHRSMYEIVREAQEKAFRYVRDGVKARDVDAVARNIIKKKGYGENFVHGLGHGVGLTIHEPPYLNAESSEILKSGNVVTVEPGIYVINYGGIRIEDTVLVNRCNAERLTEVAYTLEI